KGRMSTAQVIQSLAMRSGGKTLWVSWKLWIARPSCLRLLEQAMRLAASRTFCTAGSKRPINTAMMAITTSSSISVNADRVTQILRRRTLRYYGERNVDDCENAAASRRAVNREPRRVCHDPL